MRAALIVLAVMAGGAAGPAAAETLHKVLASPLVEEGSGPDGCTPAVNGFGGPAEWEVRVERLLLDGKGLEEVSRQPNANRLPLCIADQPVAKNADVELPFVMHDGGTARTAGVVLRFADPLDFYVAEADALAGSVRLLRIANGDRYQIAEHAAPLAVAAKAQALRVKAIDDTFEVLLDGKALFEAHDRAITAPGRFGISSRADNATIFGDLFITILQQQ